MGDFLDPGIDWGYSVLGPVRPPAPTDQVGVQAVAFLMEEGELLRWSGVVPLQLIAHGADHGVGHAQRSHEVMDAGVLG